MSVWKEILAAAVLSPSPHNVQPWRMRVLSEREADLLIERHRTLPKEDPTGSFIILTMGLFIETLTIAAANRRYALNYQLHRSPSEHTPEYIEAERDAFYEGLARFNQDFREVARMFPRECVEDEVHAFETGPFSGRDIRVKNKYVSAG